jgi:hypothetical protein
MRNMLAGLTYLLCLACSGDRATPDGAATGLTWTRFGLAEDLRIDGYEADLVPIGGLAVAENGTIAALQAQDNTVRFFDSAGTGVGSIGGRGEGPGEFTAMGSLGWLADTLWVFDSRQRRFTLISPDLQFVRNVIGPNMARPDPERTPDLPEYRMAMPQHLYPDGTVFAAVLLPVQEGRADTGTNQLTYARLSPDGLIQSLILRYSLGDAGVSIRSGSGTAGASMPFAVRPAQHVSPDGSRITVALASVDGPETETFTVTTTAADGDTLIRRTYPFEGIPIPKSVGDSVIEARARSLQERIPELAEAYRKDARVPPFYPPIEGVVNGRDGTIWIRMRETPDGRPYLVLDPQGDPVGRVVVPSSSVIQVADLSTVWPLDSDENDVESIVRYRVIRD